MSQIYIICVDDEPDVLEAVERDLAMLESTFPLEIASSAEEARSVLKQIEEKGDEVALVFCDHVMAKETGVEFLCWMDCQERWHGAKKALLTGQAGLDDTISAINDAHLDYYVSKPWTRESLLKIAKRLLTDYVIEQEKNPMPYLSTLDTARLTEVMHTKGLISDS